MKCCWTKLSGTKFKSLKLNWDNIKPWILGTLKEKRNKIKWNFIWYDQILNPKRRLVKAAFMILLKRFCYEVTLFHQSPTAFWCQHGSIYHIKNVSILKSKKNISSFSFNGLNRCVCVCLLHPGIPKPKIVRNTAYRHSQSLMH